LGKIITIGEVRVTTKDPWALRKITFFSLSLLHEEGAQSIVVDLEVVSKSS
jgi:hypothetical protein